MSKVYNDNSKTADDCQTCKESKMVESPMQVVLTNFSKYNIEELKDFYKEYFFIDSVGDQDFKNKLNQILKENYNLEKDECVFLTTNNVELATYLASEMAINNLSHSVRSL